MLHDVTADGGLGFCHTALPGLLPPGYHGPLVIALDSNVLIDLEQHGAALLNDEPLDVADAYAKELDGLNDLLESWLFRDIRFVVTPRSLTDAKKATQQFLESRVAAVEAIADSLCFQFGDWTTMAPSALPAPTLVGRETGLPEGADRDLVLEAQSIGAHVFLTRDRAVLTRVSLSGPAMAILAPSALREVLTHAGVLTWLGGVCGAEGCPYGGGAAPAPDMGKWSGLLSIFKSS